MILQQVQSHPYLLLLSALLCLPALPLLVRVFLPGRVPRNCSDDTDGGFFVGSRNLDDWGDDGVGWSINLLPLLFLFWPAIRFALFLGAFALLTLGIFCGFMVFLR